MKAAIAYVLTFLLGPILGAIGSLVLMPVTLAIGRGTAPVVGGILTGIVQSFVAAWVGTLIFGWFGLKAGLLMLVVLGVGFLLNDFGRMSRRGASALEVGYIIGDVGGLVVAALVLL